MSVGPSSRIFLVLSSHSPLGGTLFLLPTPELGGVPFCPLPAQISKSATLPGGAGQGDGLGRASHSWRDVPLAPLLISLGSVSLPQEGKENERRR